MKSRNGVWPFSYFPGGSRAGGHIHALREGPFATEDVAGYSGLILRAPTFINPQDNGSLKRGVVGAQLQHKMVRPGRHIRAYRHTPCAFFKHTLCRASVEILGYVVGCSPQARNRDRQMPQGQRARFGG